MKYLTTGQVAKIFGVSDVAVRYWIKLGKIQYIRTPGGRYLIPETEIKKVLGNYYAVEMGGEG